MRRAASKLSLAPPTCNSCNDERPRPRAWAASIQTRARGGTRAVWVTASRSISSKQTSGLGEWPSTTRPPTDKVPMNPGQHMGKLWAMGSTARYTLALDKPQRSTLARRL